MSYSSASLIAHLLDWRSVYPIKIDGAIALNLKTGWGVDVKASFFNGQDRNTASAWCCRTVKLFCSIFIACLFCIIGISVFHNSAFAVSDTTGTSNADVPGSPSPTTNKQGSWVGSGNHWWYRYSDGTYPKNTMLEIKGATYYFDAAGWMKTGWLELDGGWYYFNGSGARTTGWQYVGGSWYYMDTDGVMLTGKQTLGEATYFLASSGAMHTGWVRQGSEWCYYGGSGAMSTGWICPNGVWYYLGPDGVMLTGLQSVSGKTYFLNDSGAMHVGWKQINGKWYCFDGSGAMQANKWISGVYWVGSDGVMATDSWVDGGRYYVDGAGRWVAPNNNAPSSGNRATYASGSDVYHIYNCRSAAKIKNPIVVTVADAQAKGLRLCGNCANMSH